MPSSRPFVLTALGPRDRATRTTPLRQPRRPLAERRRLALDPLEYPQTTIEEMIETWDQERAFNAAISANPPGPKT